jgi:hypothetical protein
LRLAEVFWGMKDPFRYPNSSPEVIRHEAMRYLCRARQAAMEVEALWRARQRGRVYSGGGHWIPDMRFTLKRRKPFACFATRRAQSGARWRPFAEAAEAILSAHEALNGLDVNISNRRQMMSASVCVI